MVVETLKLINFYCCVRRRRNDIHVYALSGHCRSPAQSHLLRSPNPVFQVVSSQVVSSTGSGHHTSQPCNRDGVIYNTPSAYTPRLGANGLPTSVPEMNPDHIPYHLRNDRYSSPSPSPSQQVCSLLDSFYNTQFNMKISESKQNYKYIDILAECSFLLHLDSHL